MRLRFGWLLGLAAWALVGSLAGCSSNGTTSVTCDAPQVACGGVCLDVTTSPTHCGACGNACTGGRLCVAGRCQYSCAEGQTACGDVCADTQTDGQHCGTCNRACPRGQVCARGACALECGPSLATCATGAADAGTGGGLVCANTQTSSVHCGSCGNACPVGQLCRAGRCEATCPEGQMACVGRCADVLSDNENCGSCRARCATGFTCQMGRCRFTSCPAGRMMCGTTCSDPMSDQDNCGACGTVCRVGEVCTAGRCVRGCAEGQTLCGETCVDTRADLNHCGMCGTRCPAGQVCVMGACAVECAAGQMLCGGRCVDPTTDRTHCGRCGNACTGSQLCTGGACATSCGAGQTNCAGTCVNTAVDPANCGTCGTRCAAGQACVAGACRPLAMVSADGGCAPPSRMCGATCTDTQSDNAHCGMCGRACTADRTCVAGMCVAPCAEGQARCGGACVDVQTDRANCGRCGNACPGAQVCLRGACSAAPPTRYMPVAPPTDVAFIDACAAPGHTEHLSGADDSSTRVPLPFAFRYWATDLAAGAMVNITSNGWIGMAGDTSASLGGSIPSASAPNAVIAPHWGDNYNARAMCVATTGTAPNRRWVVEWNQSHYCCTPGGVSLTYEVILSEGSNTIDFVYQTMTGVVEQTTGIENQAGTAGVGGCPGGGYDCAPATGTRVRFTPIP